MTTDVLKETLYHIVDGPVEIFSCHAEHTLSFVNEWSRTPWPDKATKAWLRKHRLAEKDDDPVDDDPANPRRGRPSRSEAGEQEPPSAPVEE